MLQRFLMKSFSLCTLASVITVPTFAQADSLSWGNADTDLGKLTMSGWVRANYQDKDYSDSDHKLKFNAAKLSVKYDAKSFFGQAEYRCYQNDTLCDFSTLVNANVGYKLNEHSRITVGLQDMPFGIGRFWSSSWYGSSLDNAGLEDVHNLGIDWQQQLGTNTVVNLAYFVRDGGHFVGDGDAARYAANYVKPDDATVDEIKERNMWVARINQQIPLDNELVKLNVGGSYWYSDLKNSSNDQTGHRNAWNIFGRLNYQDANLTLTAGQNRANTQSLSQPDYATVGSFESKYYVANDANYYVANVDYKINHFYQDYDLTPYASYTIFDKDKSDFATSTRSILGAQLDMKQFSLAAEYITGKNDVFIGGDSASLAEGDSSGHSRLLNLLFIYNF
ncbi:MAG: porin [Acinetobacter sp.]